VKVTKNCY